VFHENEFLLRIRESFEEVIERIGKTIKFLQETLFQLIESFVDRIKALSQVRSYFSVVAS
jgi:hypothetical protein